MHVDPKVSMFVDQYNCITTSLVHGLLAMIKKEILLLNIEIYKESLIEVIATDLKIPNNILKLVNIYNRPNNTLDTFLYVWIVFYPKPITIH